MSAEVNPLGGELQERIQKFLAEGGLSHVPPEVVQEFRKAAGELVQSGLAGRALKAGAKAPGFSLPNATGQTVTLSGLLEQGPVVVVFYRGEWCPYCNIALHAYQENLKAFEALGARLVAISPQTPDNSLKMSEKHDLKFEVLSDVGNQVAGQYGLVFSIPEPVQKGYLQIGIDLTAYNGDDSYQLPMPGTFVIAPDGTVEFAFVDANHLNRVEPAAIIQVLEGIQASSKA